MYAINVWNGMEYYRNLLNLDLSWIPKIKVIRFCCEHEMTFDIIYWNE